MMSLIMIAVTLVSAIAGVAFMFRKHSDSDDINRNTKAIIIFITLAIVTAVAAVILSMFSSGAPLP